MDRAHVTDYFIGAEQKISNWLVKTFPRKVKTAIRLGIKFGFNILDFSMGDDILGLYFFCWTVDI